MDIKGRLLSKDVYDEITKIINKHCCDVCGGDTYGCTSEGRSTQETVTELLEYLTNA